MRRQTPIAHLLYNYLYPNPHPNDPPSFSAHLARNLVPEVRIEVATFYGDLNTTEARYPGLNYCHPPHRMRLGRFKHHKRLFDAFDNLGLTYNEIQGFCCWEGTRWARERYEKDEGVKVEDTTGNEIKPYVDRRLEAPEGGDERRRQSITRKTDISVFVEDVNPSTAATSSAPLSGRRLHAQPHAHHIIPEAIEEDEDDEMSDDEGADIDQDRDEDDEDDDDDDDETPEEAAAREQHMAELAARRDASIHARIMQYWEQGAALPADLEQYLKEQTEAGNLAGLDLQTYFTSRRGANRSTVVPFPAARVTRVSAVNPRAAA